MIRMRQLWRPSYAEITSIYRMILDPEKGDNRIGEFRQLSPGRLAWSNRHRCVFVQPPRP
jgi:hypothetical protein